MWFGIQWHGSYKNKLDDLGKTIVIQDRNKIKVTVSMWKSHSFKGTTVGDQTGNVMYFVLPVYLYSERYSRSLYGMVTWDTPDNVFSQVYFKN